MLWWVGYLLSRCNLPMAFIWKNWRDGMLLIPNCFQYPSICNKKGSIFDFAKSSDNLNLIKNTPGVKRSGQELKQALLKKMWNQMGGQCLLVLIGLKVLVMINCKTVFYTPVYSTPTFITEMLCSITNV